MQKAIVSPRVVNLESPPYPSIAITQYAPSPLRVRCGDVYISGKAIPGAELCARATWSGRILELFNRARETAGRYALFPTSTTGIWHVLHRYRDSRRRNRRRLLSNILIHPLPIFFTPILQEMNRRTLMATWVMVRAKRNTRPLDRIRSDWFQK